MEKLDLYAKPVISLRKLNYLNYLRDFVLNSRHLGPRRVWKGGSEPRAEPHFRRIRWIGLENSKTSLFSNHSTISVQYWNRLLDILVPGTMESMESMDSMESRTLQNPDIFKKCVHFSVLVGRNIYLFNDFVNILWYVWGHFGDRLG